MDHVKSVKSIKNVIKKALFRCVLPPGRHKAVDLGGGYPFPSPGSTRPGGGDANTPEGGRADYPSGSGGSAGPAGSAGSGAKSGTASNSSGSDYFKEWQAQFNRFIRFARNDRIVRAKPLPVHLSGPDTLEYILDLPDGHKAKIALLSALHTRDKASLYDQINKAGDIEDVYIGPPSGNDAGDNGTALMDSGDSTDTSVFVKLASGL